MPVEVFVGAIVRVFALTSGRVVGVATGEIDGKRLGWSEEIIGDVGVGPSTWIKYQANQLGLSVVLISTNCATIW